MSIRSLICHEKIVYGQPAPGLVNQNVCQYERKGMYDTHEYVAISSYAVECPIPFSEPAVASERCVSKPLSDRPTFITRRSKTRRFERKSDELNARIGWVRRQRSQAQIVL